MMLNIIASLYSIAFLLSLLLNNATPVDSCCCSYYPFWANCGCNVVGCNCDVSADPSMSSIVDVGACYWSKCPYWTVGLTLVCHFTACEYGPWEPDSPHEWCADRRIGGSAYNVTLFSIRLTFKNR